MSTDKSVKDSERLREFVHELQPYMFEIMKIDLTEALKSEDELNKMAMFALKLLDPSLTPSLSTIVC